jgi:hypothetical protein
MFTVNLMVVSAVGTFPDTAMTPTRAASIRNDLNMRLKGVVPPSSEPPFGTYNPK